MARRRQIRAIAGEPPPMKHGQAAASDAADLVGPDPKAIEEHRTRHRSRSASALCPSGLVLQYSAMFGDPPQQFIARRFAGACQIAVQGAENGLQITIML